MELAAWTQIYSVHTNRSCPPTGQSRCRVSGTYTAPPSAGQTWQHLCSNSEIKYKQFFSNSVFKTCFFNVFDCWFSVSMTSSKRHVLELRRISMRRSSVCPLCSSVVFIHLYLSFLLFSYDLLLAFPALCKETYRRWITWRHLQVSSFVYKTLSPWHYLA